MYLNSYLILVKKVTDDYEKREPGSCKDYIFKIYVKIWAFHRQDEKVNNLVAICFSVNCFPTISAWEHTFAPREYLVSNLEDLFMK